MSVKISGLPNIEAATLISANTSAIPLIAGDANVITYQTSVANVKTYVETGNLNVTGAISASANSIVYGTLTVVGGIIGNTISGTSSTITSAGNFVNIQSDANLTYPPNNGLDVGLRFFYNKGSDDTAALIWKNSTGFLTFYESGVGNANLTLSSNSVLGTIQTGRILVDNNTTTTANATGALQVSGGTSIGENLWVGGNIDGKGYISTTGATTTHSLAVNNSTTVGGTLSTAGSTTAQSLAVNTVATIGSTLVVSSTATVNALTSNGNITGTNVTATVGRFSTSITTSGTATVNSLVSNGAISGTTLNGSGTATVNALVVNSTVGVSGTTTTRDIVPSANISYNIGSTSSRYLNVYALAFSGQSTSALYADLAEKYEADSNYLSGTVVVFGGTKEITVTDLEQDVRVAGVISTAPAYLMNSESAGLPVALRGKVPVNVIGPVVKGSLLVTSAKAGYARAILPIELKHGCAVIAKSLVEDPNTEPRVIMAVIV